MIKVCVCVWLTLLSKYSRPIHSPLLALPGFVEVETPILLRSSPEGAREFLVPTRVSDAESGTPPSAGRASERPLFYALQQSPQQPKQLLICSGGVDRYFQLAKCFRDEDGRKDRQPEFTQVDLEMAYVSWGQAGPANTEFSDAWRIGGTEVRETVESLIRKIWSRMEDITLPDHFPVMTYREAMTRVSRSCFHFSDFSAFTDFRFIQYGSDKPDTRFGLEVEKPAIDHIKMLILFHFLTQIMNITPNLPPEIRSVYERSGEALECIIVRKSNDSEFIRASRACRDSSDTVCYILIH